MAQKYFRKAGVPKHLRSSREKNMPEWLQPSVPDQAKLSKTETADRHGSETDSRQVFSPTRGMLDLLGTQARIFNEESDARAFYDELSFMLANQQAPNSPQWFNTGLNWAYGMTGPAQGHYYVKPENGEVHRSDDAYTHPQPHACFIQSVQDDLVQEGGIMDLWTREARLFKYGSGTGSNFLIFAEEWNRFPEAVSHPE